MSSPSEITADAHPGRPQHLLYPKELKFWHWVLMALAFRLALALSGGQMFLPDEYRSLRAHLLILELDNNGLLEAIKMYFSIVAHQVYALCLLPVAIADSAMASLLDLNPLSGPLTTVYHSLISALNVGMVFLIARKHGLRRETANWCAGLALASVSLLFYSRHYLPYDTGLFFALWAVFMAVAGSEPTDQSLKIGILLGLAYYTYNGMVLLVAALYIVFILDAWVIRKQFPTWYAVKAAVGVVSLPLAHFLAGINLLGIEYYNNWIRYTQSVILGDFSEGPWLVWQYFWGVEGFMLLIWLTGIALAINHVKRANSFPVKHALWLSLGIAATLYLILSITSAIMELWVVYGRTARMMTPFLCLAAGIGLSEFFKRLSLKWRRTGLVMIVLCAANSLYVPYAINYPNEVRERFKNLSSLDYAITIGPPGYPPYEGNASYLLLNADFVFPYRVALPVPDGEVIYATPHPFHFPHYALDALNPQERKLAYSNDYTIRLIRLANTTSTAAEDLTSP